ncbi:putative membrane protein required for colicin V production [Oikeobacillus pervagus]|uniref:Membrane protein required for colicin V production n=1 Tax=Oikeobacillus pervagus TaxID=1325931 RepID=A0AAJ1T583_9BACI|nr:CvpA family protein [Oikeobacillus pervagus]MDQ0215451.1 putative membrane protein required for colicin V production [Oikeobacillus pervagus]
MMDLILFFLLIGGIIIGLKRGLILQLIHMGSAILSLIIAYMTYDLLAPKLVSIIPLPPINGNTAFSLFSKVVPFEHFYYGAIAFIIIFFVSKIALHIIGSILNTVASIPIIKQMNSLGGGVLGFLEVYILLFVLLYLGALIPNEGIHSLIDQSFLSGIIINHTPFLSEGLQQLSFKVDAL